MRAIVLLEKRTYFLELLKLFNQKPEISIKEIKRKIPSASYYRFLLPKIVEINSILNGKKLGYLIKPVFLKQGSEILSGLKIHPDVKIKVKESFIILCYEKN